MMNTIQEMFKLGMKRDVAALLDAPEGPVLNLGAGNHPIPGAINIDYPEWNAENYHIQVPLGAARKWPMMAPVAGIHEAMDTVWIACPSNSVACVHAYHFLEHIVDPRRMLREIQRVLMPGGIVNIVVPHYLGSMAFHDLDHKNYFALDTWSNTFSADYEKDRGGWNLKIHLNIMMAIAERNMAILTQLVKGADR